jgi:hypothetical protein
VFLQLLPGQLPAVKIAVRNNRRKRALSATFCIGRPHRLQTRLLE